MTRRTPYTGTPIPDNFNRLGRPPNPDPDGTVGYTDPIVAGFLTAPHLAQRLSALVDQGQITFEEAHEVMVDLRQHRRAMEGERALPGEYLGRDDLPYLPLPGADEEPYLEDRQPGSPKHKVLREAVERMDADRITSTLIQQMDENAPEDSTWARSDPNYRPPTERATAQDNAPASLRESIQASVDALGN